jgi:hypothetical protein
MVNKSFGQIRMGIYYEASQGQAEKVILLKSKKLRLGYTDLLGNELLHNFYNLQYVLASTIQPSSGRTLFLDNKQHMIH